MQTDWNSQALEDRADRVTGELSGRLKTRLLTLFVIASNIAGNLLLSHGMRQVGTTLSVSVAPYVHALGNPFVIAGVCILTAWMISDLALLSRADLSYVLPVTSCAYVIIAILGHFLLSESISPARWIGILTITLGVTLVGGTNPRTTPEPPPELHHGAQQ